MDFSLDKLRFKLEGDPLVQNFRYHISAETFGEIPTYMSSRIEPNFLPTLQYPPSAPSDRQTLLTFDIPASANQHSIIHPQGGFTDFLNYQDNDSVIINFSQGTPSEKGGGVIRDTNYPPPNSILQFSENLSFDQRLLSLEFKIDELTLEKMLSGDYKLNVSLFAQPNSKYQVVGMSLVLLGTSNVLLMCVETSSSYTPILNFEVDIPVDKLKEKIVLFMWKGVTPPIAWPLYMFKKGMIWLK